MESFGKPDFLADGEVGKAAPSYSNFPPSYVSMDEFFDQVTTQFARQQYGPTGGTSGEVLPHLGNTYSSAGSDLSQNNLPRNGTGNPRMTAERAVRKRAIDKAYRDRLKQDKIDMKYTLETLNGENENLKIENERLQREHDSVNKTLQSRTKLINQLKSDLEKLTEEYKKQHALVQRLSELLACPDLQLENERLKFENDQLRRNASVDHNILLAVENGKLKLENKVLRVQNDALCGKLINDCDKKHV